MRNTYLLSAVPALMVIAAAAHGQKPVPANYVEPQTPEVRAVYNAYGTSRFADTIKLGSTIVNRDIASPDMGRRKSAVQVCLVVAYAFARQKDMPQARTWFDRTRDAAATLPDHGARPRRLGNPMPNIEEEAAFQHAVCTGAIGYKEEAEHEYKQLMKQYPESPLVHGAVKRIAKFHGGDIPPESERIWKEAMKTAQAREKARRREESLCGPECVAEILRRTGRKPVPSVHTLANEMKSDHEGTTMAAIVSSLKKHGLSAKGLALSKKGLSEKYKSSELPLITLLAPGHFVLLEKLDSAAATVWDPYANGIGKPGRKTIEGAAWTHEKTQYVIEVSKNGK